MHPTTARLPLVLEPRRTPTRREFAYACGEIPEYLLAARAVGEITIDRSAIRAEHEGKVFTTKIEAEPLYTIAGTPLTPTVADLLHLAHAVYASDRLCPRDPRHGAAGEGLWRRKIHLSVAVLRPDFWNTSNVRGSVEAALNFLTDDAWTISFCPLTTPDRRSEWLGQTQLRLPEVSIRPECIALFSGGLDSFAGTAGFLGTDQRRLLSVSACTHNRLHVAQVELHETLRAHFGANVHSAIIRHGFVDRDPETATEPTQRARGFFHTCLAAVSAELAGLSGFSVFENGIGAFNLPMDSSQMGAQTSRAVHPLFLVLMENLFSQVFGRSFHVEHPFLFHTKTDLLARLRDSPLAAQIHRSVTCDRYPDHFEGSEQCGVCPSCLLRRLSIRASGLNQSDDDLTYAHLIEHVGAHATRLRFAFHKLGAQAHRFDQLFEASVPAHAWFSAFPTLREARRRWAQSHRLSHEQFTDGFLKLFRTYLGEWYAFAGSLPPSTIPPSSLAA